MRHQRTAYFIATCAMIISLAACGFTPVYVPGSQVGQSLSDITVASPNNREEYLFVRHIEERLSRNPNAGTILKYNIAISEEGLDIYNAARSQIFGNVSYQLASQSSGEIINTGFVSSFTGYSATGSLDQAIQRDAVERLAKILADKVITDLTVKLSYR